MRMREWPSYLTTLRSFVTLTSIFQSSEWMKARFMCAYERMRGEGLGTASPENSIYVFMAFPF